ncbi:MAG: hypothetical protein BGP01_12180 [Paludibacter sp. 47-17]|nr:MAG: hypothetical protein BGP01_12180 [Paludibacter sp. 47-17]
MIRRTPQDLSAIRLQLIADTLILDYESGSVQLKSTLNELAGSANMLEFLEQANTYLRQKSMATYQYLMRIIKGVVEYSPFPRVLLLHMLECPAVVSQLKDQSVVVKQQLVDYVAELNKEKTKSLSKKQTASMLKKRQLRLRVEFIVLLILAGATTITGMFLYVAQTISPTLGLALIAVPVALMLLLKFVRYGSLDGNLKTNPHLTYQIDLLDIPDSYIDNLNQQLEKLEKLID